MEHNFDYLKDLHIEDPDEFDKITSAMINSVIDNVRPEMRKAYRARQWRLEQELEKIKDPVARMNRMVSIFWKGVGNFVEVTKNVGNEIATTTKEEKDNIIDFKKKSDD